MQNLHLTLMNSRSALAERGMSAAVHVVKRKEWKRPRGPNVVTTGWHLKMAGRSAGDEHAMRLSRKDGAGGRRGRLRRKREFAAKADRK